MDKKLISTFIATIILVALTIGIGVILYFYFAGYVTQTKSQIENLPVKSLTECSKANVDIIVKKTKENREDLLEGYSYKIPITIKENSGQTLTDYQILVTLDTQSLISQGKMKSDCSDIRFTDSDGTTLLNYWIESGCNTQNTRIWVKVPFIQASSIKTIYVYYGNPNATSLSNGTATFLAFDLKLEGPLGSSSVAESYHSCALVANGSVYCWG
ncbi:MAG: DUF2341 domain-containing protein, partial [Candidatus Aenigmatarchaeota archaeon]